MPNTRCALVLALATVALLAGCRIERNKWQEEPAPEAPATANGEAPVPAPRPAPVIDPETGNKRIVLFAPTDIGPLAELYPEAKLDFPHEMAKRIDLLVRDADGRVGELLPSSEDPRWDKGRVGATYGSHLVVLTRVLSLKNVHGSGGAGGQSDRVVAFAEMRAFDADGKLVFTKKASGESAISQSPKTLSASAKPESRAAWQAIDHAFGVLRRFVAEREDLSGLPNRASQDPLPTPAPQVEVAIDTDPARADIVIDGQYRGTTPQTIPLPTRPVTVRLERQGYQAWERQITPSAGMRIQPALEPLAGTVALVP
ncbi:MAG: PEGA domain-containing protein, partial [Planctomycetes bacterium]|nr:PEGA domain-containing protein [Planctomycetota bacterium]